MKHLMKNLYEKSLRESQSQPRVEFLNRDLPSERHRDEIGEQKINADATLQSNASLPILAADAPNEPIDVKTLTGKHFKPKSKKLKHIKPHSKYRRTTAIIKEPVLEHEHSIHGSSLERDSNMRGHKGSLGSFDAKSITAFSLPKQHLSAQKHSAKKLRLSRKLKLTTAEGDADEAG